MNALIIDDEKLVARELIARLADVESAIKIVGSVGSIKTACGGLLKRGS